MDRTKRTILKLYGDDISKYAGADAPKVRGIYNQLPGQLSKKEKKYFLFYSRPDRGDGEGRMEIDFLIRRGDAICPVEVKRGAYQHHASLDKFMRKFGSRLGDAYILYTKDLMTKNGIHHLPLYMAMFL